VTKKNRPTDLANRLHTAAIHLLRGLRDVDEQAGISARRLSALSVIVFAGPISLTDLAAAEQVSLPTTSRMMKDMEADNLIERIPDPADKRSVRIQATTKGLSLFEEARQRRIKSISDRVQTLTNEQIALLEEATTLLEKITLPPNHPNRNENW
jgi:DNA-binding MarR family transcriptional regulator